MNLALIAVRQMMDSAYEVERWLKQVDGAPKSRVHLRGLLSVLLEYAMLLGVVAVGRNPMELVRIEGASRRLREPRLLSYDEFARLLAELREPYRTMAILIAALGLRCSEVAGLKWENFDQRGLNIFIRQGVVNGHEDDVKTPSSKSELPIDPSIAEVLIRWREQTVFQAPEEWIFASPFAAGHKPYHRWSAQNQVLSPAGIRAGIGPVGWHDLRHSHRMWLDETGAPVGVQKELMRHANIATTMNVYGGAMSADMRKAHRSVVRRLNKAVGAL